MANDTTPTENVSWGKYLIDGQAAFVRSFANGAVKGTPLVFVADADTIIGGAGGFFGGEGVYAGIQRERAITNQVNADHPIASWSGAIPGTVAGAIISARQWAALGAYAATKVVSTRLGAYVVSKASPYAVSAMTAAAPYVSKAAAALEPIVMPIVARAEGLASSVIERATSLVGGGTRQTVGATKSAMEGVESSAAHAKPTAQQPVPQAQQPPPVPQGQQPPPIPQAQHMESGAGGSGSSAPGRMIDWKGLAPPVPRFIHTADVGATPLLGRRPISEIASQDIPAWYKTANDPSIYEKASVETLIEIAGKLYAGKGQTTISHEAMTAFQTRVRSMDLGDVRHATFINFGNLLKLDEISSIVGDTALRQAFGRSGISISNGLNQDLYAVQSLLWQRANVLGTQEALAVPAEGGFLGNNVLGTFANPAAKKFMRARAGRSGLKATAAGIKAAAPVATGTVLGTAGGFMAAAPLLASIPGVASWVDFMKPLAILSADWSDKGWMSPVINYWSWHPQYTIDRTKIQAEMSANIGAAGSERTNGESVPRVTPMNRSYGDIKTPVDITPSEGDKQKRDALREYFKNKDAPQPGSP